MEEVQTKRHFRKSILILKLAAICAIGWSLNFGLVNGVELAQAKLSEARAAISERFKSVEIVREYLPREQKPISAIVKEVARRHNISSLLITALITQESGQQLRTDRMRYEAHLQGRFKCQTWMNPDECRAQATSWGLGQVIPGFWAKHCGLQSYSDLLDPEINLNCSASILAQCLQKRAKVADKMERYRQCLAEYNGSDRYPPQVFEHLMRIIVEQQL